MNNLKHKVSYHKVWDSNGTCYTQCITITVDELLKGFKYCSQKFGDWEVNMYSKSCREFKDGIYFANLTQSNIIMAINGIWQEKRALPCRNTCFKIVKNL